MKFQQFLNITFASSPVENQLVSVNLIFFYISPLKSSNLVLIPGAKLDGHLDT